MGVSRFEGTLFSSKPEDPRQSVAQNERPRVTQVSVFGSIWQGAILVHLFEPQPHGKPFTHETRFAWIRVRLS